MSFVKVILDESSLNLFCNYFGKIEDPLSRILVLRSVYDMTLAKVCPSQTFSQLALSIFKEESDVN
jgi:hypothetical protein